MTHNVKVGSAVLIGIAILVAALSFVGGERFTKKNTYKLNVVFENVQGLTPGAKIWLSGVEIGKVDQVELRPDGKAELKLVVGKEYKIMDGAEFTIKVGLLKDTILSIKNPDIVPAKITYLKDNDTVTKTSAPAALDDLVSEAHRALGNVNDMLLSVKEIVGDDTMKQNIFETVENVNKTTYETLEFAKMLKDAGMDNRANIDRTIYNIAALTDKLNVTAQSIDALVSHANDVAGDPKLKEEIKQAVTNLNSSLANIDETTKALKDIVTDKEIQSDLKDTIKSTKSTMQSADVALSGFSKMVKTINGTEVKPAFEFRYNNRENKFHADMNLRLLPPEKNVSYIVGLDDLGEHGNTTLMLGVPGGLPGLWYRFGVKSGKLGIGADWDRDKYYYEGDLINPNDLHCNLRVGKKLNKNLYGIGGWEGAFKENGISMGFLQKY